MKIIIISGPSGSGKTTLSIKILKKFRNGVLLSTDNYYKTGIKSKILSIIIKNYFDRIISFNYKLFKDDLIEIINTGVSKHTYSYNFKNKTIQKSLLLKESVEFIVLEGIFSNNLISDLQKKDIVQIEMRTKKNLCMARVINRDMRERGKTEKLAKSDFLKAWKIYNQRKKKHYPRNNITKIINTKETEIIQRIKDMLNFES